MRSDRIRACLLGSNAATIPIRSVDLSSLSSTFELTKQARSPLREHIKHRGKRGRSMRQPQFFANQTWFPALLSTMVFVAFYVLLFSGLLGR